MCRKGREHGRKTDIHAHTLPGVVGLPTQQRLVIVRLGGRERREWNKHKMCLSLRMCSRKSYGP